MGEDTPRRTLGHCERIILGFLAGAIAVGMTYPLATGYIETFQSLDLAVILGFVVRILVGGVVGGVWAYIHDRVESRRVCFELGLVAPAVVSGIITANASAPDGAKHADLLNGLVVAPAYAQQTPPPPPPSNPPDSFVDRFIKGLVGK